MTRSVLLVVIISVIALVAFTGAGLVGLRLTKNTPKWSSTVQTNAVNQRK